MKNSKIELSRQNLILKIYNNILAEEVEGMKKKMGKIEILQLTLLELLLKNLNIC